MTDLPTNCPKRRSRSAAFFVIIGLLFLAMLSSSYAAWADSSASLRRGTVPTPTPKGGRPTQPATDPAAKPPPTRVVPPTRTPCLDCPTPVPLTFDRGLDILVNVGGPQYTDSAGQVWQADQEYVEGLTLWGFVLGDAESGTFTGHQPISGTDDAKLYQDERWAMAGYRFELPNGDYRVTLKFAEQYVKAKGKRAFNIKMQGTTVIKELDLIAAAGGPFIAVDQVVTVTVKNQLLAIDFESVAENPTIAAIRITAIAGTGSPVATTVEPTATPTPTATRVPRTPIAPTPPTATPTETATPTHTPTTTPLPVAVRLTGLFPQYDSALRAPDGSVFVHVPAGAVPQAMSLLYIPESSRIAPPANVGFQLGSVLFTLQPLDPAGTLISRTVFLQPITVTVRYSAEDLDAAGHQLSRLILGQYRPEAGEWMALDTLPDPAAGKITARARRTGLFAVMIHTAPAPLVTGTRLSLSGHQGLAALGIVVVLGGLALLLVRLAVSRPPARLPRQAAAEATGE